MRGKENERGRLKDGQIDEKREENKMREMLEEREREMSKPCKPYFRQHG